MKKYLFLTYGEQGWRGVQMRAIRIAAYLPKTEVLFWECDDPEFIRSFGFDVEKQEAALVSPSAIEFPQGIDVIIFADLPSNLFFSYGVYIAALKRQKKVVICEQLYRKGQMREGVFQEFAYNSDLFLLNGLSSFKSEESGSIQVVPPQIELELTSSIKQEIRQKYDISASTFILFGAGYHPDVLKKIEKVAQELSEKHYDFCVIISGSTQQKEVERKGNIIYLPFQSGEEYFKLLYTADATLVKFGFLQILESLALHKPTIVLGEGGYVLRDPEILDLSIRDVLFIEETLSDQTIRYLEKLITDEGFKQEIIKKLRRLHDGSLFGGREAARAIEKLRRKKIVHKFAKKKVAILINDEILEKEKWLKEHPRVYPLCFILPMPSRTRQKPRLPEWVENVPLKELTTEQNEILPHSFRHLFLLSSRKADGLIDILPWYEEWVEELERVLHIADVIYIGILGKQLLRTFLRDPQLQSKVVTIG